ncbi:hypothetical protein SBA2_120024 [Acidobacteriia bacterium SbA2]|nr:hypothetical protein SBA2_120024 [Acidobacteriia bacterium SbA2]
MPACNQPRVGNHPSKHDVLSLKTLVHAPSRSSVRENALARALWAKCEQVKPLWQLPKGRN